MLVLGGARSGKSRVAEAKASELAGGGPVTYVATAVLGKDADLARRVERHQARRPASWTTVEVRGGELLEALRGAAGTVLVDGLGPWVAAHGGAVEADAAELCGALAERKDDTVIVSDEVGLGVHPSSESGRRFRDHLGSVNQAVADVADSVVLVVAGRVLALEARSS